MSFCPLTSGVSGFLHKYTQKARSIGDAPPTDAVFPHPWCVKSPFSHTEVFSHHLRCAKPPHSHTKAVFPHPRCVKPPHLHTTVVFPHPRCVKSPFPHTKVIFPHPRFPVLSSICARKHLWRADSCTDGRVNRGISSFYHYLYMKASIGGIRLYR